MSVAALGSHNVVNGSTSCLIKVDNNKIGRCVKARTHHVQNSFVSSPKSGWEKTAVV